MKNNYTLRDFDWTLLGLAVTITILGVLEIYSATSNTGWQDAHLKQILWLVFGLGCFWFFSVSDYKAIVDHATVLYITVLVLLLLVLILGLVLGGGRRWFLLPGGLTLQISEFAKVVLVLLVAKFFSDVPPAKLGWRKLLKICLLVGVPVLLVARQPDLSTALSFVVILVMGVFLAGLRWKYILVLGLGSALLLPLAWQQLKPYQKNRLVTFLDPEKDPHGAGYQAIQSKIAVGAGGIWGAGFARGSQTQLLFIPVPHTDFVFSAYAEEGGFVGVTLALALYFGLLMKMVGIALHAPDDMGMHICMGTAALLLFHLVVNVGMVIGRMPVTGLPLPLMSYGGSNLLAMFALLGLVNSVYIRRFTN